ncbi:MAG: FAD-binding oxidoreductase [Alphaproteobacteria bacterium]|nr:FAD-binding oxidoreductase [Alphaproteobacteria bacterium]
MSIDRRKMRWNGWGWIDHPDPSAAVPDLWSRIAVELGMPALLATPARPLGAIDAPAPRLGDADLAVFKDIVGEVNLRTDAQERASHARGKSYHDLLILRSGRLPELPDAVLYPSAADEVLRILGAAEDMNIAVVPFGGGSSVVGGVTARSGPAHAGVLAIDTTRMTRLLGLDHVAKTARIEPGLYGPQLEEKLNAEGVTLGHYPQSFEFSTLGGWIAARGAGQQSNRYGKAEKWLVSANLATPRGLWTSEDFPASAAGPRLGDLIPGSEGTLGIITEATVRVKSLPEVRDYRAALFLDFLSGLEAVRAIAQNDIPVAMLRLSDADETWFFQAFSTSPSKPTLARRLTAAYLKLRGFAGRPCVLLYGLEGDRPATAYSRGRIASIIRGAGGLLAGTSPGKRWYHGRFASPYLRDPMMDHGLGVDTLETATRWSNVEPLYRAVRHALLSSMAEQAPVRGAKGIVLAHVSHSYPDGASLYFTYVFPRDLAREIEQWHAIKTAASDAIARHGGTISHHHGVGEDHSPWLPDEKGPIAMMALRALKRELDPKGILNPGKLLA